MEDNSWQVIVMLPGLKWFTVNGPSVVSGVKWKNKGFLKLFFADFEKFTGYLLSKGVKTKSTKDSDKDLIEIILSKHTANERIKMLVTLLKEDVDRCVK